MGAKISVDSATMMNKALEVIEAHHLFSMPPEKIDVLIHPQSVVHSMVEYRERVGSGSTGGPGYAHAHRLCAGVADKIDTPGQRLDFQTLGALTFAPPDPERFPALPLAYACLRAGPAACIAFNAANEVAVEAFLAGRTGFSGILEIVRRCGGMPRRSDGNA